MTHKISRGTVTIDGVKYAGGPSQVADVDPLKVLEYLSGKVKSVASIAKHFSVTPAAMCGLLCMMEVQKVVKRLPANLYERIV